MPQDHQTIAGLIGPVPMAIDLQHGRALLALTAVDVLRDGSPAAAQFGPVAGVTVNPGERFAVARGVAVVPVRGILTPNNAMLEKYLGWATYQGLVDTAAALIEDEAVSAVILDIDCPGGLVMGMEDAAQALTALAAIKPVYAIASPLAASAAYWLACSAGSIAMTPGGYVGSIGTMRESAAPVQPDLYGNQWAVHLSSHARAKSPDPTTDAGRAEIQRSLDESEARFHSAVAAGRGIDLADLPARLSVTDDPADGGAVFRPEDAIERGLADTVETRAAFYGRVMAAHAPAAAPRKMASALIAQASAARARAAV